MLAGRDKGDGANQILSLCVFVFRRGLFRVFLFGVFRAFLFRGVALRFFFSAGSSPPKKIESSRRLHRPREAWAAAEVVHVFL